MSDSSCDYLGRGLTLRVGLREEARNHMKEPPIGLGIQGQPSTGPLASALMPTDLSTQDAHFPLGLAASAAPGRDCIILGFVRRAAGGGVGPAACHLPSLSSLSTPSWVTLLLPPFSGPWHPRNRLPYPEALGSLSIFSHSPGSPRGYGG